jgi:hypothetical protein
MKPQEDEDEGDAIEEDSEEEAKQVEDTHSMLPMYRGFEEKDEELEPLPEENSPNYPQENKFDFASKKKVKNYVRNDKMTLHDFHAGKFIQM